MSTDKQGTPEYVAFLLLEKVAFLEGKAIQGGQMNRDLADREWLLNAYADCLKATQGKR